MNDNERMLIRYVCEGNLKKARLQAEESLKKITAKKDERFKENMLRLLAEKGNFIEVPYNLQNLLIAEDMKRFPEERFILREDEQAIASRLLAIYKAAGKLSQLGIPYMPSLILHGQSGCGKTMLARYIAHVTDLPFIYVKFSNLVCSLLGKTQENLGLIFQYVKATPCVLCLDEIDAIGMARGQKDDVGEMNRVVIALMQELDRLPQGNSIIIGTTNRMDRLDSALKRRFSLQHEVKVLSENDVKCLAEKFLSSISMLPEDGIEAWIKERLPGDNIPASKVINECTEFAVQTIIKSNGEEYI